MVEGGSGSYTVKLSSQPSNAVTVTVDGTGSGVTVDTDSGTPEVETTLNFTTSNWETEQTVTVVAAEDDNAVSEAVTLTHSTTSTGYDYSVSESVKVSVIDNDTANLVLVPEAVTVAEADSATYTVSLAKQPTDGVTVTVGGMGSGVSVDTNSTDPGNQQTLSFTTTDWNTLQTVTVSGEADDNASPETITLTHTATGGGYGSVSQELAVTVTDDDTPGLVFSPTPVMVAETGSATYTVKLATEPTDGVMVTVGGRGVGVDTDSVMAGDQASLSFTTSNWQMEQTVTVRGKADDNASPETVTLTHTGAGGDYGSLSQELTVTVTDSDTPGLVFSPTALTVEEEAIATYTVKLATAPTDEVTVTVGGKGVSVDTDSSIPGEQASLSFTIGNWQMEQKVMVHGDADDNASPETVALTHTARGGGYDSLSQELAVTVTDNDTPGLVFSPTPVTVVEEASATYTVRLATEPTDEVMVTVSGSGVSVDTDRRMAGDQASLTFTTSNWQTGQTVTVRGKADDNDIPQTVTLTHTGAGGDYGSVNQDLVVIVQDDDTPALLVSPTAVTMVEDTSATYTVVLATEPTADVYVTVSGMGSGVSVDTNSSRSGDQNRILFTRSSFFGPGNWSTERMVMVRAVDDGSAIPKMVTLTHTTSDANYEGVSQKLVVTVTENICQRYDVLNVSKTSCDLSGQGISSLSPNDFLGLSNLQELDLGENNLSSLSENVFAGLSGLNTLYLNDNQLRSLRSDVFAGLSNLQTLSLQGNDLISLSEDVFDGLSNLQTLSLRGNDLKK